MKRSGSIVVFSLMIVSVILVLTEQLLRSVYVSSSFVKAMVEREQAQVLALSGLKVAMAQLTATKEKKSEPKTLAEKTAEQNQEKSPEDKKAKYFLTSVLPHLNRWQVMTLEEKFEGVDGELKICIVSEEGKININEIFDFEKQEFRKEYEMFLKGLIMRGKIELAQGEIMNRLLEFLKKRRKKLDDISELYGVPGFEALDIFYKPPKLIEKKGEKNIPNADFALQDIFTIWSSDAMMHPLLFSDALCAFFGLRRPMADDAKSMKDKFKQLAEAYKDDWGNNWDENWKSLQLIYDQKPKVIKQLEGIFSKQFGPKIFSVLSYGKVGSVEQRLLAVIKQQTKEEEKPGDQKETTEKQAPESKEKEGKKPQEYFRIMRLYWL